MFHRVRISWGKMKNFKCVDYFQVEYYQHTEGAAKLSDKINRHRTFVELEIKPCTDYTFKVRSAGGPAQVTPVSRWWPRRTGGA